jgi:hypothetical protein
MISVAVIRRSGRDRPLRPFPANWVQIARQRSATQILTAILGVLLPRCSRWVSWSPETKACPEALQPVTTRLGLPGSVLRGTHGRMKTTTAAVSGLFYNPIEQLVLEHSRPKPSEAYSDAETSEHTVCQPERRPRPSVTPNPSTGF